MKRLRIAQIAPVIERVPPKKYGGIERVIHALTEELVERGHDVTLFASGDSKTRARLISVTGSPLRYKKNSDPYGPNAITALHYGLAYKMQSEFDIIHDHLGQMSVPAANLSKTPVVATLHGHFTPAIRDLFRVLTKPHVVTISKKQFQMAPDDLNHAGTVYNGLDMEYYPFSPNHKKYLLYVGRIALEKGTHFAVNIAKKLGLPLLIAAKLDTKFQPDVDYFNQFIKPNLNEKIQWLGEVDEKDRNKLMTGAMCLLHPVTWPEPFGLTMIETMVCGTPVIAFKLGSIPEVIEDGKTGFVVLNEDEMLKAIGKIDSIDRAYCRKYSLKNFSAKTMTDNYEKIYYRILESEKVEKPEILKNGHKENGIEIEPLNTYSKFASS